MNKRISKAEFYRLGGFSNPSLFRKQPAGQGWRYYQATDHPAAQYDYSKPDRCDHD